ncbi:hypothetical protein TD95_001799 [Thielaviopsis punctulata]|uniref:Peptidase C14 caspase domain-containing protein n=1 Tax=Thielaviopsis punctulata TaxID=72032 RepID=A0A0F4ZAF0_9PEZI|nr:hypothetical protein TD95_001799 [Thielaviopsis punctulata]
MFGFPGAGHGPHGGGGGGGYRPPPGPPPPGGGYGGGYPQQTQQQYAPPQYAPPQHAPPNWLDRFGMAINGQGQQSHGGYNTSRAELPPSGAQKFGHGAPEGYSFQYSNCTGRRKALLIGINYFNTEAQLRGCINDVHNVSRFIMEKYGYKREDMVILTDDQTEERSIPTRANILRAMRWLVSGAQPNDALFFHYSGHGGQAKDTDGDEEDGYDEVIYPVDFKTAGHIVDDEIHAALVSPLQPGVRLTAIVDACHSGSVLDLPYLYSTKGVIKEPNLAKEAGEGLLSAFQAYARNDMTAVASEVWGFVKKATKGDDAYNKTVRTKTSPADVILWSGSKDDQTSADATINSQATGAMSWAFISAMTANSNQSYLQLLNSIRELLESKYSQRPQMSSSHPIDVNLKFVM